MLTVAARHADNHYLVKTSAADYFDHPDLNLEITGVSTDNSGTPDLALTRAYGPGKSDAELLSLPSVLSGSPRHIADTLIGRRERWGVSYFTVQDYDGGYFAQVINALRWSATRKPEVCRAPTEGMVGGSQGGIGDDGERRKVVTLVHRSVSAAVGSPGRVASWFRKDYPKDAPERGHNYLVALCGMDYVAR